MIGDTARIAALEAENERLREQLDWYRREVFGEDIRFPLAWRLTRTQARLLAALLSPLEYMTTDALMIALYAGNVDDEPDPKIIDVVVCQMRPKLRPYGVEIQKYRGFGFSVPNPRRSELRRALRLVSGPPWEHAHETERRRLCTPQPRTAPRLGAQDRLATPA